MISNKNSRRYEVSLWTLQDGFITVLKEFNSSVKGTIKEPEMELSDDSEDTFSFSLPMYIREKGLFIENPIWYNVTNGNLIANLRKVKVIFYKGTKDQRIFEFVITKVTETHEGFEKRCEVECEGLAYNELGKVGYNIELSQDIYEMEYEEGIECTETCLVQSKEEDGNTVYYITPSKRTELLTDLTATAGGKEITVGAVETNKDTYVTTITLDKLYDEVTITYKYTPLNNINYWLDKIFEKLLNWSYRINMDWSDYPEDERDSDKVYEDAYIENWEINNDGVLVATSIIDTKEKFRIVEESESNRYNLTQTVAETFGVFCRYIYEYDDNYYITNRIVEFYNSALKTNEEHLDFTYYYDTEDLSREMDSADQISKMFVLSGSGDDLLNSSITEVDANKSLENYLLNFDYLYQINGIDLDLYDYIPVYETKMREYNKQLLKLMQQKAIYEDALNEFKVKRDSAQVMEDLAEEAMEDARSHIRHLLASDKVDYDKNPETLSRTGLNPVCCIIVTEGEEGNKTKSCTISHEGVFPNTILAFTSMRAAEKYHKKRYGDDESGINLAIDEVQLDGETKYMGRVNDNGSLKLLTDSTNSPYFPSTAAVEAAANTWAATESGALITGEYLSSENYQVVIDPDTGFATGLKNIKCSDSYSALFLVFDYSVDLYYKILAEQWATVANEQAKLYADYAAVVDKIDGPRDENDEWISDDHGLLLECIDEINRISELKRLEMLDFENYMGPALREGTWQPDDDYAKYGDKRQAMLALGGSTAFSDEGVSIGWDGNLFDGEESNYDEYGINKEKIYYPCIKLTTELITAINDFLSDEDSDNRLLDIGFLWDDTVVPGINPLITSRGNEPIPVDFPQIFRIGSEAEIAFIKSKDDPDEPVIPVLMLTNADAYCSTFDLINETGASQTEILQSLNGCIGTLDTEEVLLEGGLEGDIEIRYVSKALTSSALQWISNDTLDNYERVYPRIRIPYVNFVNNLDDCRIYLDDTQLNAYADYNVMSRYDLNQDESYTDISFWQQDELDLDEVKYAYYITLNPETIIRNGVLYGNYKLCYKLSNTGLAIYLDALQVLKENAYPKVTYDISPIVFNTTIMEKLYDQIHRVIHINDPELKFKNVTGYISGLTLNLDAPAEDTIEVKNYTTKFEDLFSSIVASTASIKKNATSISVMSQAFISTGEITPQTLLSSLELADLTLRFNNDNFIINNNGIKAYSDDGIVHYSSLGIFTATTKDANGNWEWNTSILPSGISANSITTGQLNTNLIRIYSGNDLRFLMNGDGLFAYKSWFTENLDNVTDEEREEIEDEIAARDGLDPAQYVVMNSDGLFLTAKEGAYIFDDNTNTYTTLAQDVNRVEISWDGLILRNNNNQRTFYADPDTGDLNLLGNITVEGDNITAELNSEGLRFGNYRLVRTLVNNSECLSFVYEEGE